MIQQAQQDKVIPAKAYSDIVLAVMDQLTGKDKEDTLLSWGVIEHPSHPDPCYSPVVQYIVGAGGVWAYLKAFASFGDKGEYVITSQPPWEERKGVRVSWWLQAHPVPGCEEDVHYNVVCTAKNIDCLISDASVIKELREKVGSIESNEIIPIESRLQEAYSLKEPAHNGVYLVSRDAFLKSLVNGEHAYLQEGYNPYLNGFEAGFIVPDFVAIRELAGIKMDWPNYPAVNFPGDFCKFASPTIHLRSQDIQDRDANTPETQVYVPKNKTFSKKLAKINKLHGKRPTDDEGEERCASHPNLIKFLKFHQESLHYLQESLSSIDRLVDSLLSFEKELSSLQSYLNQLPKKERKVDIGKPAAYRRGMRNIIVDPIANHHMNDLA